MLHHKYLNGGSMRGAAEFLLFSARQLLSGAVIYKERENYKAALKISLHLEKDMASSTEASFELYKLWLKFFRPIADDVIMCSVFELYLKANLLKKGYVVHRISAPKSLSTAQKKKPIHKRTIQAMERKGISIGFSEYTLNITELTSKGYKEKFKISASARKGFKESKWRRNMVHFTQPHAYSLGEDLVNFLDFLDRVICPEKSGHVILFQRGS